jgi:acyl-coenzyme A thioesterase PaaI-like protein
MASPTEFYALEDDADGRLTVRATEHTAGPWSPSAQHGGPPMALMARAIEGLADDSRGVARLTCDLLGPVPVSRLRVGAEVVRPGRTVELVEATLLDVASGRTVARAAAWLVPRAPGPKGEASPASPGPEAGHEVGMPTGWHPGYLDAIEWSWVEGALGRPGPAMVWMRPRVTLLPGEPLSPVQRLMVCVDSASGASAVLDIREWQFMNTELTAHLVREPVGEWIGLRARTVLGGTAAGVATADVVDPSGFVARSAQSLLVRPSSQPTD